MSTVNSFSNDAISASTPFSNYARPTYTLEGLAFRNRSATQTVHSKSKSKSYPIHKIIHSNLSKIWCESDLNLASRNSSPTHPQTKTTILSENLVWECFESSLSESKSYPFHKIKISNLSKIWYKSALNLASRNPSLTHPQTKTTILSENLVWEWFESSLSESKSYPFHKIKISNLSKIWYKCALNLASRNSSPTHSTNQTLNTFKIWYKRVLNLASKCNSNTLIKVKIWSYTIQGLASRNLSAT